MDRLTTPTVQPLELQVSRRYIRVTPVIAPGLTATVTVSVANEPTPVLRRLRSTANADVGGLAVRDSAQINSEPQRGRSGINHGLDQQKC